MKPAPLTLLLACLCASLNMNAQVFFAERINLSSCMEKGDIQCAFSSKLTHIYRSTGYSQSYHEPAAETDFRLFNQCIDAGYAVSKHFIATVSYMHEKQDGNIYITGNAKYGIGDRGSYSGNRVNIGGAYLLRVLHKEYMAIYADAFMGGQQRTPNADDETNRRFRTSYAGFNFCPAFGVKTDMVDFSLGPRLSYQQFFNGKADAGSNVANTDLFTGGGVADFAIGYRFIKFSLQTGLMGPLSNKQVFPQGVGRIAFYTNAGILMYIGRYYNYSRQSDQH